MAKTRNVGGKRATKIERRRIPTQARALETVERIVATAAILIAEVGLQGFNTNLLAERAGVTVPTVYRYFPNKLAVIDELARRLVAAWDTWFDDEALADPELDWRATWAGYVDAFVTGIQGAPAGLAIRGAIHSMPELRSLEERDTRHLARRLARALRRRDPSLASEGADTAAELLLTTAIAAIDRALTGPPRKRAGRIAALKQMQIAYLETILEPTR